MPPAEYSLRLQRGADPPFLLKAYLSTDPISNLAGITGGFAPPTPDAIHTITKAENNTHLLISSAIREIGTPNLGSFAPKSLLASSPHTDTATLVDELHGILKELPTEMPVGSEDIYGMDVSIAWGSEDLMWCNGGPEGCGGGASTVQATEEEKRKFSRAVQIVEELVGRGEATESY